MELKTHEKENTQIAEVISDSLVIAGAGDGLDLLGTLYFQGYSGAVLYENTITPDFFDLKTGIAGEILQKFTNYRVKLAIVGDFKKYTSKPLRDFIAESNRGRHVHFAASLAEALEGFF
ncbi:MAG: DUF4180 domain-containing protein [Haliscomenobacter sp.]|jgi:uncharacterized alpha/beta hydrolase family protein|nr:DUF4180 domain-containing protein [Haliscomenobacter sp.]MBV6429625.1 hypothetical protein [Haliscomenobacter sp.]